MTDIALRTASDESQLFGDDSNNEVVDRLRSWGNHKTVLKRGANGSLVADDTSSDDCLLRIVPKASRYDLRIEMGLSDWD